MDIAFAADMAFASASAPGGGGAKDLLGMLPLFIGMFAIMYFVMIRPQQQQRRQRDAMMAALKRGDRVVTTGGLHGTVTNLNEHTVVLRVADQVKVEFDRSAIGRVVDTPSGRDA
jgi:preprotein translocase subunit YajC